MALRALQGPTGGGTPVGGSGTTNTIPRWTGPSTLGDSGLIDDGSAVYTTTRFIGIGTASPARTLDIQNNTQYQLRLGLTSAFNYDIGRSTADGLLYFYGNQTGFTGYVFSGIDGERARIDSNGNIYGTSGTTGMTNGFFYIPAAAGAPTGTPTAVSGRVPMYYDTTNNEFYVYNGAWKKVALA